MLSNALPSTAAMMGRISSAAASRENSVRLSLPAMAMNRGSPCHWRSVAWNNNCRRAFTHLALNNVLTITGQVVSFSKEGSGLVYPLKADRVPPQSCLQNHVRTFLN